MANNTISKGYKSEIKLPLPQTPAATADMALFSDLVDVYNSIHMLNAVLEQVRTSSFNMDKDAPLDEQMPFKYTLWLPAAHKIDAGKIVTIRNGKLTVGWEDRGFKVPMGMALTAAEEEDDKVKVGFGPALIKFSEAKIGDTAYVICDRKESEYPRDPYGSITLDPGFKGYRLEAVGKCYIKGYLFMFTSKNYSMAPF